MQKPGQTQGRNYVLEFRFARGNPAQLENAAAELVQMRVDAIVTDSGAASIAAKRATATIPIVMGVISDPVELGLVASLARPGGNVTGFSNVSPQLGQKRLGILKEAVPEAALIGVLTNPASTVTGAQQLASITKSANMLHVGLAIEEASGAESISAAIDRLIKRHIAALMVVGDAVFFAQRRLIVERANVSRIPAIYPEREFAEAGGLLAYGPDIVENFRRAAGYVVRTIRGERAGDLPVEQLQRNSRWWSISRLQRPLVLRFRPHSRCWLTKSWNDAVAPPSSHLWITQPLSAMSAVALRDSLGGASARLDRKSPRVAQTGAFDPM
jgi:putative ABC transport system substrate-binding protein